MPSKIIKRNFVSWDKFIYFKVKTLHYWLNYVAGVGRENIVNEGAIKYGIAEFFSINCDPFTFEDYHNTLPNSRHIDLTYNIQIGADNIFNVCEFKQLSESTYSSKETNRYFADLCRLSLYRKNYHNQNPLKTYFLVAGKTVDAYQLLPQRNGHISLQLQPLSTPILEWLSFDINNPNKAFKLSYFKEYKTFVKEYKKDKLYAAKNRLKWLRGNNVFRTKLIHIEGLNIGDGGFLVAAWEVL